MVLWYCGTVVLWYCGMMWYCGGMWWSMVCCGGRTGDGVDSYDYAKNNFL